MPGGGGGIGAIVGRDGRFRIVGCGIGNAAAIPDVLEAPHMTVSSID